MSEKTTVKFKPFDQAMTEAKNKAALTYIKKRVGQHLLNEIRGNKQVFADRISKAVNEETIEDEYQISPKLVEDIMEKANIMVTLSIEAPYPQTRHGRYESKQRIFDHFPEGKTIEADEVRLVISS